MSITVRKIHPFTDVMENRREFYYMLAKENIRDDYSKGIQRLYISAMERGSDGSILKMKIFAD